MRLIIHKSFLKCYFPWIKFKPDFFLSLQSDTRRRSFPRNIINSVTSIRSRGTNQNGGLVSGWNIEAARICDLSFRDTDTRKRVLLFRRGRCYGFVTTRWKQLAPRNKWEKSFASRQTVSLSERNYSKADFRNFRSGPRQKFWLISLKG